MNNFVFFIHLPPLGKTKLSGTSNGKEMNFSNILYGLFNLRPTYMEQ